ncbi:30S ribosomal protein S3 [Nanoarchaeota archaeon]
MMERDFVAQKIKEFQVQEFIEANVNKVGHSHTLLKKTPLGEKVIIYASRPGLVVGRKGSNIKALTAQLKKKFNLENPQIEINEVENVFLVPEIVAEKIAMSLERFGTGRFKGVGHKMLERILDAGALGVEILISGKVPGARARTWRFYQGYLKKCGEVALTGVRKAYKSALLKTGIIGIQVRIMPPDIKLPDTVELLEEKEEVIEEVKEGKKIKKKETKKEAKEEKKEVKEETKEEEK